MATLVSLREQVTDITRDPNYRIRPLATLDRAINNAYVTIQQDLESYIDDSNQTTTVAGVIWTQEYTLPTDFLVAQQIRRTTSTQSVPLLLTTKKKLQTQFTTMTTGVPTNYYIYAGNIWLYPIPLDSWTIEITYTAKLATITTSVDSANNDILDNAIAYKAASMLFKQVQKLDESQIRAIEAQKEIDSARMTLRWAEDYRYEAQDYWYIWDYSKQVSRY